MLNVLSQINWLAVILSSLAICVLGGIWFMVLFSKAYTTALGRENAPKEKPAPIFIIGPFVCGVVTTITSAILIYNLDINTMASALEFGAIVGFGYIVATAVNVAINPNIPRPFLYSLVSGSYFFISSLVTCVILVSMK